MQHIELFAGAGGLALGLERAGIESIALNELDRDACETLRRNRSWNILQGDIRTMSFSHYRGVDLVSGGFPCQSFSCSGNRKGFDDARGALFFEFARAVHEMQPKIFLAENVRQLIHHLPTIANAMTGYTIQAKILNAVHYEVPQKRQRLIIIGLRNDKAFSWPSPSERILTLRQALAGVPASQGRQYSKRKQAILALVPEGGCWRNLPEHLQPKMSKGTGVCRRLAWNSPAPTLTCTPDQTRTDRCHPEETRPLTIREYARIQTFPDDWEFAGSIRSQYRQIGNAVPVNLAYALGNALQTHFKAHLKA